MKLSTTIFSPRWALLAGLLFAALAMSGCVSRAPVGATLAGHGEAAPPTQLINEKVIEAERRERERSIDRAIANLIVREPPPYRIDRGDILSIVVWDHPELAPQGVTSTSAEPGTPGVPPAGFVVDHEGRIQLPLAGLIKVAGLTAEQARALVARSLARYLAMPNVTLRVQAYRSKRVYIDGEVRTPGLQAINDIPMTLMEALNRAGGLLPSADQSRIVLERGDLRYQIDLRSLVQKGINPGTVLLRDGDVVRVHSRDESKVFVSGEVISPKALTMHNGRLTLNEALGESGGISPTTGDARQVYVIRKTSKGTRVFQLDARRAGALAMAEAFELRPKDLVYVAASPLANWHRNLSMLFPGALTQAISVSNRP
jgi:polysaccharide export outer membrane protein